MLKICGTIYKNSKIVKEEIVTTALENEYQTSLTKCIREICEKMDIDSPYWLPNNIAEYNKRRKVVFTEHNFMNKVDFNKFVVMEIKDEY